MIKIIKTIETVSKITFTLIFAFVMFSSVSAQMEEASGLNAEDESMYKYHALENKLSFVELAKNSEAAGEEEVATEESLISESKFNIKEELRVITEKQNFSLGEIRKAMSALEDRSEVATFLVGNNLAVLRFQLVQVKEEIILLEKLAEKTDDTSIKIQIYDQIDSLTAEQKKVEEFISDRNNEFSLFGWFARLL